MWDGGWPYAVQQSANPDQVGVINVAESGHCGWFAAGNTQPSVVAAVAQIHQQIDKWLN